MVRYVLGVLFFGVFLTGGLFVAHMTATQLPLALEAGQWPTTEGHITTSEIRRRQSRPTRHSLVYQYTVDGQFYAGDRIAFMDKVFYGSPETNAQHYPQGQRITVFYNPDDPSNAVLDPRVWWLGFGSAGVVAVVFTLVGLLGLRVTFK